jgi:hypothetical protein
MLNALIVGGTGLLSTGITRHLLARGAKVTMYNRGLSQTVLPAGVRHIVGDRADRQAFVQAFAQERFDVVSQFHCAYSSAKAKTDVPEFRARIGLEAGASETFADMRARGVWRDSGQDTAYQHIVERALALGFEIEEA